MKGTSEAVECGTVCKERIGERGPDELARVCGDVATLVVTSPSCQLYIYLVIVKASMYSPMYGDVQSHEFYKVLVSSETEQVGKVVRVVFCRVDGGQLSQPENIAIDAAGDIRKLCDPGLTEHI